MWNQVSYDPRSYERSLSNCVEAWKIQDFNGVWTRDLAIQVIVFVVVFPFHIAQGVWHREALATAAAICSRMKAPQHNVAYVKHDVAACPARIFTLCYINGACV